MEDIPTGSHTVKLGDSFNSSSKKTGSYHAVKYDSYPTSVQKNVESYVGIGDSSGEGSEKVAIVLPSLDNETDEVKNVTVFRGQKQAAKEKDCILLFNHETGELTLEQLSSQIRVKKTREQTQNFLEVVKHKRKSKQADEKLEDEEDDGDGDSSDSSNTSEDSDNESNSDSDKEKEDKNSPSPDSQHSQAEKQLQSDLRLSDSSDND